MELIFSIAGGLVVALVFQLLLANFGVALGLTVLDWAPEASGLSTSKKRSGDQESSSKTSSSEFSLPVTHLLGFGVAVSLSAVIFAAALLSAEFSQILDPRRGVIFGLIFWATYWLLFIWLSSSTAVSVADSVLGSAIAGGRQLISAMRQALPGKESDSAVAEQSLMKSLAAEISQIADVQQALPELLAAQKETLLAEIGDRTRLSSEQIADLLKEIKPAEQDRHKSIRSNSPSVPTSSRPASTVQSSLLSQLDLPDWKQMLGKVLDGQIDLSDLSVKGLWQQLPALSDSDEVEFAHKTVQQATEAYLRHAPSWSLQPEVLKEVFIEQIDDAKGVPGQVLEQLSVLDRDQVVGWLQERKDLGVERVEAIADQLSDIQTEVAGALSLDKDIEEVEEQETEEQETEEQEAGEQKAKEQSSEGVLIPQVDRSVEARAIQDKLIAYCRYTNLDILTPEGLTEKIHSQLQEHSINTAESLSIDIDAISEVLSRRNKIAPEQKKSLIKALRSTLSARSYQNSHQPQSIQAAPTLTIRTAPSLPEQLSKQVVRYLRHQEKSAFHPEQIATDIAQIVGSAFSSLPHPTEFLDLSHISSQVSSLSSGLWDKSLWEEELAKRRDMTTDEIQQILEWGESAWQPATQKISSWLKLIQEEASELVQLPDGDFLPDGHFLAEARQQIVEQISSAQEKLEAQAQAVKADVQRQADAVRKQVAIATWWLFTALLLSGIAAGSAGWLAAIY